MVVTVMMETVTVHLVMEGEVVKLVSLLCVCTNALHTYMSV